MFWFAPSTLFSRSAVSMTAALSAKAFAPYVRAPLFMLWANLVASSCFSVVSASISCECNDWVSLINKLTKSFSNAAPTSPSSLESMLGSLISLSLGE